MYIGKMTLRKFWKVMKWWSQGRTRHPLYRKVSLDDIARVETMAKQKHDRHADR